MAWASLTTDTDNIEVQHSPKVSGNVYIKNKTGSIVINVNDVEEFRRVLKNFQPKETKE